MVTQKKSSVAPQKSKDEQECLYESLNFEGLERRPNYRIIAMREDILVALERKDAAAILFHIIWRWQIEVRREELLREIDRRKKVSLPPLTNEEMEEHMWIYMSYNDFVRETGGAVSYNTVVRTLDYLVAKGVFERRENHDPHYPDYEYRINRVTVRRLLKALPVMPPFTPKVPKQKRDSTHLGTGQGDSTQMGIPSTQMGIPSTHLGIPSTHLGTGVYPNGGTSQDLHRNHTDLSQVSTVCVVAEEPQDIFPFPLFSHTHTPEKQKQESLSSFPSVPPFPQQEQREERETDQPERTWEEPSSSSETGGDGQNGQPTQQSTKSTIDAADILIEEYGQIRGYRVIINQEIRDAVQAILVARPTMDRLDIKLALECLDMDPWFKHHRVIPNLVWIEKRWDQCIQYILRTRPKYEPLQQEQTSSSGKELGEEKEKKVVTRIDDLPEDVRPFAFVPPMPLDDQEIADWRQYGLDVACGKEHIRKGDIFPVAALAVFPPSVVATLVTQGKGKESV